MGGSSGALYGILLTAAFKFLSTSSSLDWVGTWKAALGTLQVYSQAKVGDRTMVIEILDILGFCWQRYFLCIRKRLYIQKRKEKNIAIF